MSRLQDIIAFFLIPAICAFVLYVWTVRCGILSEPHWFESLKGPSYPTQQP